MDRNQEAESIAETYCERLLMGNDDSANQELFMVIGASMLEIDDVINWLQIQFSTQLESGQIVGPADREKESILPLHAVVLWRLYHSAPDEAQVLQFIQKNYHRCLQWHSFFYGNYNSVESGLIERNKNSGSIDPYFNAMLCWSNQCLLNLGYALDLPSGNLFEKNELTLHLMNELLWDNEECMYLTYDSNAKMRIRTDEAIGFLPMLADIPEIDQAISMVKTAFGNSFRQEGHYSIPSMSFDSGDFDSSMPNRGGIAIGTNWLFVQALDNYGFDDMIDIVRRDSLELITSFGIYSHFDPRKSATANGFKNANCPISALVYLDFHSNI